MQQQCGMAATQIGVRTKLVGDAAGGLAAAQCIRASAPAVSRVSTTPVLVAVTKVLIALVDVFVEGKGGDGIAVCYPN
jgi:hypothetical protein